MHEIDPVAMLVEQVIELVDRGIVVANGATEATLGSDARIASNGTVLPVA